MVRNAYEDMIKNSPAYSFIPSELRKNWLSVSKGGVNPRRTFWEEKLSSKLQKFVNVARDLHPTKFHVCKGCEMPHSIFYVYPNKNTWKWLEETFGYTEDERTKRLTIFEIFDEIQNGEKIVLFQKRFKISIDELKRKCYDDQYVGKNLSPGVMSNAPDRLDGFHDYASVCGCREKLDPGRSRDNMSSYVRDRRAYMNFSDGRILLANTVMGKMNTVIAECPVCHKTSNMSADHIGPVSLGFVHDPDNFQAMCKTCNSAKGNRLNILDIQKLNVIENKGKTIVSWWAKDAWESCKNANTKDVNKTMATNAKKFMKILENVSQNIIEKYVSENIDITTTFRVGEISVDLNGEINYAIDKENDKQSLNKIKQKSRAIEIYTEEKKRKLNVELTSKEIDFLSDTTAENFRHKVCAALRGL